MSKYQLIASVTDRPYMISGLLGEDSKSNETHDISRVMNLCAAWQKLYGGIVDGHVYSTIFSDAWEEEKLSMRPGWVLQGWVNPALDVNTTNHEFWDALVSLAKFLACNLNQKRVYVSFAGEMRVFQLSE
jgi:hypothetical protein